jgi:hypothetical protein
MQLQWYLHLHVIALPKYSVHFIQVLDLTGFMGRYSKATLSRRSPISRIGPFMRPRLGMYLRMFALYFCWKTRGIETVAPLRTDSARPIVNMNRARSLIDANWSDAVARQNGIDTRISTDFD